MKRSVCNSIATRHNSAVEMAPSWGGNGGPLDGTGRVGTKILARGMLARRVTRNQLEGILLQTCEKL